MDNISTPASLNALAVQIKAFSMKQNINVLRTKLVLMKDNFMMNKLKHASVNLKPLSSMDQSASNAISLNIGPSQQKHADLALKENILIQMLAIVPSALTEHI